MVLFCPPMVYAFGWETILPAATEGPVRCVTVWSLWAWPIPAAALGLAWRRSGRKSYEAALLSASRPSAFVRVALPGLLRVAGFAFLCLFVLFLSDYSVPHACGMTPYATELLVLASTSPQVIDVAWPAIPSIGIVALGLGLILFIGRTPTESAVVTPPALVQRRRWPSRVVIASAAIVSLGLPMGGLMSRLGSVSEIGTALETYGTDLAWSLATAALAGVIAVAIGTLLASARRVSLICLLWALVLGATPGALVGIAEVAAFDGRATRFLYESWPILTLCYLARFGWVGLLIGRVALRSTSRHMLEQSDVDGADGLAQWRFVELPLHWSTLACGVCIVTCLSLADVSASSLVRIPDFNPIAHVLIEKFHRFEDDILVSLSLVLMLSAAPGAILLCWAQSDSS
jgi:ABC-type Fe3+ transport system permease subunit